MSDRTELPGQFCQDNTARTWDQTGSRDRTAFCLSSSVPPRPPCLSLSLCLCVKCYYCYNVEIQLTYTDTETMNEKWYLFLTQKHLTQDPRFYPCQVALGSGTGFSVWYSIGRGRTNSCFFFNSVLPFFSRSLFFALATKREKQPISGYDLE